MYGFQLWEKAAFGPMCGILLGCILEDNCLVSLVDRVSIEQEGVA